jgi:citrate/tricarballylate utilization protein
MPGLDILQEANRQLTICNACRYCEGFCPVFQAIEIRHEFKRGDIFYLSNLCHDCRACYYACMFTPPHEFAVNIPQILSEARIESYQHWSWPKLFAIVFARRRAGVLLACLLAALIMVLSLAYAGPVFFKAHAGPGAFYEVIPYLAMVVPALGLLFYWLVIWINGGFRFWSDARVEGRRSSGWSAVAKALSAALSLKHLGGGGPGCSYPEERPSSTRRVFHSLVFWGFFADFISTTLAFVYQDFLGLLPPYSLTSGPVVFGSFGGMAIIIGTAGLIWIKARSDRAPAGKNAYSLDYEFLVILGLTALTGMGTLLLRATSAMGIILSIHLGFIAALFLTAPYGKFVHALYRPLALIQFYVEQDRSRDDM